MSKCFSPSPEGHTFADLTSVYWIGLREEKILLRERDPGPNFRISHNGEGDSPGARGHHDAEATGRCGFARSRARTTWDRRGED